MGSPATRSTSAVIASIPGAFRYFMLFNALSISSLVISGCVSVSCGRTPGISLIAVGS